MSLQRIDLNLFKVFEAVIAFRSVAAAAKHLGVTPSAVSHAIGRLRLALGDELFVPGEAGMVPTPRALEIAPGIQSGLGLIQNSITTKVFSPGDSTRLFRISATDYGTIVILGRLVERIANLAPNIEFCVFPYSRPDVVRSLDDDYVDLIIGWFDELPKRIKRRHILFEREALIVRRGHPLTEKPASKDRVLSYSFLVVEMTGTGDRASEGFMDERGVAKRVWMDRLVIESENRDEDEPAAHVAMSVPYYSAVPSIIRSSDTVAAVPERLGRQLSASGDFVLLDLSFRPWEVAIEAIWHERDENDEALQWLMSELTRAAESI
jgi:DNA-binding transcriptional LysR family regulator